MPFFKCEAGLVHFCHVPKCGGTTVEEALLDSGFELSFLDTSFWQHIDKVWYKSSPQCILANDFKKLIKNDIFAYKFAIVRNPVSRFLSAFNNNRRKIGRLKSIEAFLNLLEKNVSTKDNFFGAAYDNHFVPANRLVLEGCEVFHLERGLGGLEARLRMITTQEIDFTHKKNVRSYDIHNTPGVKGMLKKALIPPSPQMKDLSDDVVERIKLLYSEDYERFDFE